MLTPAGLGRRLGDPAACASHRAERPASGRTSTGTGTTARPAGVPANALRFVGPAGCERGVYWVSATGTHQLLAVTVRLTADERTVGECRLPTHVLRPSGHHTWRCPMTDAGLRRLGSYRNLSWAASYAGSLTEPSHAAALARADRAAATRLG
jgi:hypothetical protein